MTSLRRSCLLSFLLLSSTLFTSCASHVKLAADYDPVLDQAVTELYVWTLEFLGQVESIRSDDDYVEVLTQFHSGVRATIGAMEVRASIIEDGLPSTPLTDNFTSLKRQYDDLVEGLTPDENDRALLDNPRVFQSSVEAFNQSFRAVLTHLLFLKGDD